MPYCDILNRPYFIVPPDDPRVGLLLEQEKQPLFTGGFSYKTNDGKIFISPGVYFGTIMIYEDGSEANNEYPDAAGEVRRVVLEACGGDTNDTVRMDFAWVDDGAIVLRAGVPGGRPVSFSRFAERTLIVLRNYVSGFMSQSYANMLMSRGIADADNDILFEGEEQFYEGFIGRELMPLEMNTSNDGALICDGLAVAPEGSLAYKACCDDC